ncbi:MAG: IS3 family transposase [Chlorobi bacterium]|nr:IS3 family transposase [Chlorobiota bacterium]
MSQLCQILNITRQAYYKQRSKAGRESLSEEVIIELVKGVRKKLPRIGGKKLYLMIKDEIEKLPVKIGRDKFFNVLRKHNLLVQPTKRYAVTTNSFHRFKIYTNLVKELKITRVNEVFVSDITYIRLRQDFCYLFLITDVYSRKIVGYYLSNNLATEGALKAMKMAIRGKDVEGLIHHSDRGVQYCSNEYVKLLKKNKIKISMGEAGNPYDNAIAERVNGILKTEFYLGETFNNFTQAKKAVEQAIELYNNLRPHMSIDYLTPEQKYVA